MQKYKGSVKFVSNTGELALVEQIAVNMDNDVVDAIVGYNTSTGDLVFTGTLTSIIKESSVEIKFGSSATIVGRDYSLSTSTGLVIATSCGAVLADTGILTFGIETFDTALGIYGWLAGSGIDATSPAQATVINYVTGDFAIVAGSSIGDANTPVKVSYTIDYPDRDAEKIVMVRGDFSNIVAGDTIYYYYASSADYEDSITLERAGQ